MTATVDALRARPTGIYSDERVIVERLDLGRGIDAMRRSDGRVHVRHCLDSIDLDDDLAEQLADALAPVTGDHATFGSAFTGVVTTSDVDPVRGWERFYRNSIARLDDPSRPGYVEVYRYALANLIGRDVLDLGCGFGFLPLFLRRTGMRARAADIDSGALALLMLMSNRLGLPIDVLRVRPNGTLPQAPDCSVDTVTVLHVLEHVEPADADVALAEAMRIARYRVLVAVPYEQTATALYGHLRTICRADLEQLGARSGWRFRVDDHCGGWLVLDRPQAPLVNKPVQRRRGSS